MRETSTARQGLLQHGLPFVVRLRAHSAGLEPLVEAIAAGSRDPADLLALARGPLPLLSALVAEVQPRQAAVIGVLPVQLLADVSETCEKALAHRAAAEAEVVDLRVQAPAPMGALDQACEVMTRLLAKLPGAQGRIAWECLVALAEGAGLPPEGAAKRLAAAGVVEVRKPVASPTEAGDAAGATKATAHSSEGAAPALEVGPLPIHEVWEVPPELSEALVAALLAGPKRPLALAPSPETTGVQVLRVAALARLVGHHPVTAIGGDELKGADAALCFGADRLEAELDPAGAMGSRTRAYGEAAIRGAQLEPARPRRRATSTKKVAHILDEDVDPTLLPGGEPDPENKDSAAGVGSKPEDLGLEVVS